MDLCSPAKFVAVTGIAAANPSSAASWESLPSILPARLRRAGVGVARRPRTFPAAGNNCRPRENILPRPLRPLWLELSVVIDCTLPESLSVSDSSTSPFGESATCPTAFSTLTFQALSLATSFASDHWINRKKRVYLLSRLTNIPSKTLLHFLITSRKPLKVVSSFKAPRVAVSTATSSTRLRS